MASSNWNRNINRAYLAVHFLGSLSLGIYRIRRDAYYLAILAFASFLLLLLPHLFFAVLRKRPVPPLLTLVYLYCTFTFTIGMALQAYHRVPLYDKVMHAWSGVFFAFLGLLFYSLLKPCKKISPQEFPVAAAFTFNCSMMVAALWELYEYGISLISSLDPQNTLTTGVHDTMQDILACMVGAALFFLLEYRYFKKGRRDLFMASYEAFVGLK